MPVDNLGDLCVCVCVRACDGALFEPRLEAERGKRAVRSG